MIGWYDAKNGYSRVEVGVYHHEFYRWIAHDLGEAWLYWVIVDWLTKLGNFIPLKANYNVESFAKIYIRDIVRLNGVSISIVYDRGTLFTSSSWSSI